MPERLKNIYLLVSQECNLACHYCYAEGGDFGLGAATMGATTMKQALDKLAPLANESLVVSFFGGEPLLNFDLMQQAVAYGRELATNTGLHLSYAITTNATLFNRDILSFLKEHVTHIAVSLDGPKETNNVGRVFKDGKGDVHGDVVANLALLREMSIPFALRATLGKESVSRLGETANYLGNLGAVTVRLVPAVGKEEWRGESLHNLIEETDKLNQRALQSVWEERKPVADEHVRKAAACWAAGMERHRPCGAGSAIVAVTASGDVYPCNHFAGVAKFWMGNVNDKDFPGTRFREIGGLLESNTVARRKKCAGCGVRHFCGGECHAHSFFLRGDIETPSAFHCAFTIETARRLRISMEPILANTAGHARLLKFLGKQ